MLCSADDIALSCIGFHADTCPRQSTVLLLVLTCNLTYTAEHYVPLLSALPCGRQSKRRDSAFCRPTDIITPPPALQVQQERHERHSCTVCMNVLCKQALLWYKWRVLSYTVVRCVWMCYASRLCSGTSDVFWATQLYGVYECAMQAGSSSALVQVTCSAVNVNSTCTRLILRILGWMVADKADISRRRSLSLISFSPARSQLPPTLPINHRHHGAWRLYCSRLSQYNVLYNHVRVASQTDTWGSDFTQKDRIGVNYF